MIPGKFIDLFAHDSGVRDKLVAERDVVLTYALQALVDDGVMEHLAFKGGTCLRKIVFGSSGRFSEDLDFTLATDAPDDDVLVRLVEVFNATHNGIAFTFEKYYKTDEDTSFGGDVSYRHDWNSNGGFRLQVSLRKRPTLPVVPREVLPQGYFAHLEFEQAAIRTLEPIEMISEKVRATYQRAKVRDLYDLHRFATMPFDGHLLRRLAVLKLWQARDPFDPEVFFTRIRSGRYEWEDLRRLVRTTERLEAEQILGSIESRFAVLRELTDLEHALVADAKSGWNEPLADKLPRRSPSLPTVRRRSEANDPDGASAFDAGMIDHAGSPAEHPGSRYATFAERFSPMNRQRIQSNGPACKRGGPRDEFLQRRALSTRHVF